MKTAGFFIISILLVFLYIPTQAQYVAIPDTNFRAWLQRNYTGCMGSGVETGMLDTTCTAVVNANYLFACFERIADLEGVQYFKNLETLHCFGNELSTLPALSKRLKILGCDYNRLISLPELPSTLTTIYADNNRLTRVPALPAALRILALDENLLTELPDLPDSLVYLYVHANPGLQCLPRLPDNLYLLTTEQTGISCLPNLPTGLTTDLPLCTTNCQTTQMGLENAKAIHFSIFTNPADLILSVNLSGVPPGKYSFLLGNMEGIAVQHLEQERAFDHFSVTFDVSTLPEGIYTVNVKNDDGIFLKAKVLIIH